MEQACEAPSAIDRRGSVSECITDAEKQLAGMLISLEIDSKPSFPQSLKKRGSVQFLVVSAPVWGGQGREGLGPGQIHGMLPSELAKGEVHCPGSGILILMPLFSGCDFGRFPILSEPWLVDAG